MTIRIGNAPCSWGVEFADDPRNPAWRSVLKDCADALSGYAPPPGRGTSETLVLPDIGEITLIDDAYNANPASMRAALKALAQRSGTRRLVALGDMRGDMVAVTDGLAPGDTIVSAGVSRLINGMTIRPVTRIGG